MMKANSKITFGILSLSLIAGTVLPAVSYASRAEGSPSGPGWVQGWFERNKEQKVRETQNQNREEREGKPATSTPRGNVNFCSFLPEWAAKIDSRITDKETALADKRAVQDKRFEEKRAERDRKLEENRERWDANRAEHFKKLLEKAGTDAERQAILKFQAATEAAVQARKAAVNAAISAYRAEVDKLLEARKTAINAAKKLYENSYNAAIARAKQECEAGANPAEIRNRLKTELKAAKDKFHADLKKVAKLDLKPLIEKRHEAIKKAVADFKVAIEKAKEELRSVIRPEDTSATPTPQQ